MPFILLLLIFLSTPAQAQKQKLDASYEVGSELILLEGPWWGEGELDPSSGAVINDGLIPGALWAVYWNPKDNSYYSPNDPKGTITNGLSYKVDLLKQLPKHSIRRYDTIFPMADTGLLYAGSLSFLERLYIDKEDGAQHIQHLVKIEDPFPVYPNFVKDLGGTLWGYTNEQGRNFLRNRSIRRDNGSLDLSFSEDPKEFESIDGVTVIMTVP